MTMIGIKRQVVAQHERALVLHNGVLSRILGAGVHRWLDPFGRIEVESVLQNLVQIRAD